MLDGLFRPRAIAVVGASNNALSIGYIVIKNLVDHGFKGPIFPINPKGGQIQCFKAYRSVLEVPDEIDLVNISVNYKLVPAVIEECGRKGVKFAIVHTAGFKEVGGDGIAREREMVALARAHGVRIFGPNSQGVQNSDPEVSAYANFTFVPMKPGNVSIIAQSGGVGEVLKLHLHNVGLGHRMYCSYGNEADLTMPELLEYYGQDAGTRVIMMHVESFKDPAAFLDVASRITPHTPILAFKGGRTREGSVAVSSHTGTLVDQTAMTAAMFKKAGVVGFADAAQMIKAAVALSSQNLPRGRRVGIITNTGGPGIQAVDEAVDRGLVLAKWSEAGRTRLKESLYAEASLGNPVDVVATAGPDHYFAAVDTLLREDGTDMVMINFITAPFVDLDRIADRIAEAAGASDKPVVAVVMTIEKWAGLVGKLRQAGIPVYDFPEDASRVLAAMARCHEARCRPEETLPEFSVDRDCAGAIIGRYTARGGYLAQVDAFALLRSYGIPVPRIARADSVDDLAIAGDLVGFPCVLKVDSAEVIHKADQHGVTLGIRDATALGAAFENMRARFAGKPVSYVVQEQKPAGRELIAGVAACPGLGPLVMAGLGGIFVEVLKDVAFSLAPLTRADAASLLRELKGYPILEGVRGEAPVDRAAVEDLLCRVSRLAADFPVIAEMDLNPILAWPAGAVAVDARVRVTSAP